MKAIHLLIPFLLFTTFQGISAQAGNQTVKGQILDKEAETPLIGATVEVITTDPVAGAVTDVDGYYAIDQVPVGRHELRISYLGYHPITLPDVLVTAGKEVILNVQLEESIVKMDEVVVTAEVEKDQAQNEMASISARSFSLEEVTRFSGGRNDASRMAANFAGVNINNDSRNDLVIRGNSPTGVLWRLEGVAIPNPNHFSTLGTTGGPVSALNTNLLSNSDFLTSAFPAEYGNANAGVFDIHFRNGNKDKFEFTAQMAAFSGLEVMAEGPLNPKNNGSFIVSFRNSFVQLANEVGLQIGTNAVPNYRDISFKADLGYGKAGRFTFFGIGGTSDIDFLADEIDESDFFANEGEDSYADSKIGVIGMNHRFLFDNSTYLKTTIAASTAQNTFTVDDVLEDDSRQRALETDDINNRYTVSSYLNKKFNARHTIRVGAIAEFFQLNTFLRDRNDSGWDVLRDFEGTIGLFQGYAQSKYKFSDKLVLNAGLHAQYLEDNQDFAIEPRLGLNWAFAENQTLSLGFGVHNQMLPLPLYLLETPAGNETRIQSNREVSFMRSIHYVIGYDRKFGTDWRLKAEAYFQDLQDVPVDSYRSSFSVLNVGDDFGFPEKPFLVNEGSGRNYGVELTIEKFFSRGYYALLTGSLFESKYTGSDGIERSTAFNNNYILNLLAGKEFKLDPAGRRILTFDTKFTTAGGRHFTPIDLGASIAAGTEIKLDEQAYTETFSPYLRWDVKIGIQLNSRKKKFSQQFYLDFQNITNQQNVFLQQFSASSNTVNTVYQIGFFPDIMYRIQF